LDDNRVIFDNRIFNDNRDNKDNGETPTWRFVRFKRKTHVAFFLLSVLSVLSLGKLIGVVV